MPKSVVVTAPTNLVFKSRGWKIRVSVSVSMGVGRSVRVNVIVNVSVNVNVSVRSLWKVCGSSCVICLWLACGRSMIGL